MSTTAQPTYSQVSPSMARPSIASISQSAPEASELPAEKVAAPNAAALTDKRAAEIMVQMRKHMMAWGEAQDEIKPERHTRLDIEDDEEEGFPAFAGECLRFLAPLLAAATRAPATSAAARDAERLGKLLQMCTEAKTKFGPTGTIRQITMTFKASVETSRGYRDELRKLMDELTPTYAPTINTPAAKGAAGQEGA